MTKINPTNSAFLLIVCIALAFLYGTGLQNELVFDDARLTDGSVFGQYGQLFPLKVRLLSSGSFVWVQHMVGEGWVAQRAVNICIHVLNTLALYGLLHKLLSHTWSDTTNEAPTQTATSRLAAVRMATLLWAFNPVAVYAVAYLIQRSILMATLGLVISCWALIKALETWQYRFFVACVAAYIFALLSKEHAVAIPLVLMSVFVFVRRPAKRTVLAVFGAGLCITALGAGLLWQQYRYLIGIPFDSASVVMAAQLERLQPGIGALIYPLSIINQAWLFFQYGVLWLIPNVGWMQLDIRPPFPTQLLAWPQVLGLFGYLLLLVFGSWLVAKRRGLASLAGVGLLLPGLLFLTEFATVWVQDPFVLYRSYLWSIGFAILTMVALTCIPSVKAVYGFGAACTLVFAALSYERIDSLRNPRSAWTDSLNKTDFSAPPAAVGRWRPALNLSQVELLRGNPDAALMHAQQAIKFDEPLGMAHLNMGGALRALKKPVEAIEAFNAAEKLGNSSFELYFQRGELRLSLAQFNLAHADLERALPIAPTTALKHEALKLVAEASSMAKAYPRAVVHFEELHQRAPTVLPYVLSLAFAHFSMGSHSAALKVLDNALAQAPAAVLYHAQAQVLAQQGQKQAALTALTKALTLEPQNQSYVKLKQQIEMGKF